jgi:hypothetical protein
MQSRSIHFEKKGRRRCCTSTTCLASRRFDVTRCSRFVLRKQYRRLRRSPTVFTVEQNRSTPYSLKTLDFIVSLAICLQCHVPE